MRGKWKIQIDNFGNATSNSKYFCANGKRPFRGRNGKISAAELRGVGKLYHLEDEAEITQKGVARLGKSENCGEERRKREKIAQIQELEEKEKKELNSRIKKLKRKYKGAIWKN